VSRRALISVTDKSGLEGLGAALVELGFELIASGGTAAALESAGCRVTPVERLTGFPEILGGRVKTLHPLIHGGILADRDDPEHRREIERHGIEPIDLVVVNLYRFSETASRPDVSRSEVVEAIDIGGPTLIRAAAKNSRHTLVVVDPADYEELVRRLKAAGGEVGEAVRTSFAAKAFAHTAAYDASIARWFSAVRRPPKEEPGAATFPNTLSVTLEKRQDLRYGENPHQRAALYGTGESGWMAGMRQLHGKELSYNNLVDVEAAGALSLDLGPGGVAIVKHATPCGAARGDRPDPTFRRALATDPVSAFGGIVAFHGTVDAKAAGALAEIFLEVVLARGFAPEALDRLRRKKNLRLLELSEAATGPALGEETTLRWTGGLYLAQTPDAGFPELEEPRCATRRRPDERELRALALAWRVAKHARSNAIVLCDEQGTLGVGGGQPSRVDSARISIENARRHGHDPGLACAASDAFFPFPDGVELLGEAGVRAIVQPGGSVRDEEVVAAADRLDMAMLFTGRRHFRH
jgi:phosphoribosylaminoimidazolecarboxamide formyltransferase/IMP cyclohydrolase